VPTVCATGPLGQWRSSAGQCGPASPARPATLEESTARHRELLRLTCWAIDCGGGEFNDAVPLWTSPLYFGVITERGYALPAANVQDQP
jgi:hypothetical protein